ncbi:Uncharacterised protein [Bordetella pertussis]|nr:Uncharacterised protein [Bordetella pertussis]
MVSPPSQACSGGTVAKAAAPSSATVATAAIEWCAVHAKAASTAANTARLPTSVGIRRRSASLPPSVLPATSPTPNSSRMGDTAAAAMPLTPVRMGAM